MTKPLNDQWSWWRDATSGNRQPLPTNQEPQSGYYRDGARAVSIWRTERGIHHAVTDGPKFKSLDTLNDAFGRFCMKPITEELYFAVAEGAAWPEEISAEVTAAREVAGVGHNSALPCEQARDEILTLGEAYRRFLVEIGGKITTEEHDAKAETFRKRILAFEKDAEAKYKAEKAPFESAIIEIRGRWITGPTSISGHAEALKRAISGDVTPYRVERGKRAAEDERRQAEEREKHRLEQARLLTEGGSVNAPAIQQPVPKKATGLRTYYSVQIEDLPGVVAQLAAMNPSIDMKQAFGAFVDATEKLALKLLRSGAEIKGATLIEEKRA